MLLTEISPCTPTTPSISVLSSRRTDDAIRLVLEVAALGLVDAIYAGVVGAVVPADDEEVDADAILLLALALPE